MNGQEKRTARVLRQAKHLKHVPVLVPAGGKKEGDCDLSSARLILREEGGPWIEVTCACGRTTLIECETD